LKEQRTSWWFQACQPSTLELLQPAQFGSSCREGGEKDEREKRRRERSGICGRVQSGASSKSVRKMRGKEEEGEECGSSSKSVRKMRGKEEEGWE
jgi:hypothetical protein